MTIETEETLPKSKSQVKRDLQELRDLGQELVGLSKKGLVSLPLTEDLLSAVLEAKYLKMEALRRQLKHIGKLMRDEDADAIRDALAKLRRPHEKEVTDFHETETWRDKLLAGDDSVLVELGERFPDLERQHVRQLVRNAKKEVAMTKPPKSARALFRYLKEISDSAGT